MNLPSGYRRSLKSDEVEGTGRSANNLFDNAQFSEQPWFMSRDIFSYSIYNTMNKAFCAI